MQIRPLVQLRYGRINEPVRIPMYPLLIDAIKTFFAQDVTSNSSTITVQNDTGIEDGDYLLLGEPGNQNSEIVQVNGAPAANVITLDANTVYAHTASISIYVLKFNQVEISIAPTTTGVKVVLATLDLVANSETTDYNDTVSTSGYYFARYKNVEDTTFSSYSDPAPYDGYTILSARSIIDKALNAINKNPGNETLTDEFAFQEIDNCQTECLREYKRWSFMQEFNSIIGLTTENQLRVALPADVDDDKTTKSIWHFRISRYPDMLWIDKEEWDALMQTIGYSQLENAIAVNDATITLVSSGDFPDSGTVKIGANEYPYTANNKSTGVLTLTDVSTTTNSAGEDVTIYGSPGLPQMYTVWGGYIYFFPQISAEFVDFNMYLDYYKKQTMIQHDSDEIVLPDPTVVQYYLEWKFLKKLNNGEETEGSKAARDNYIARREKMKQKEWFNRKFIWKPYDLI